MTLERHGEELRLFTLLGEIMDDLGVDPLSLEGRASTLVDALLPNRGLGMRDLRSIAERKVRAAVGRLR